jgi:hypothetical protein
MCICGIIGPSLISVVCNRGLCFVELTVYD